MGKRFESTGSWSSDNEDPADIDVGLGYCVIGPDLLIEKGDEDLHPSGSFIPFPLEAIGRPVASGILARRPVGRGQQAR
jgi:hypothetical protein